MTNSSSKVTVTQIAKAAGVSPATVSRVLNHRELVREDTVQIVTDAMTSLGMPIPDWKETSPAKQPVIILNVPSINNIFYTEVIRGATVSANAHGCHLLISQSPLDYGSIPEFCNLVQRVNAAGAILLNQVSTELLKQLNSILPIVQCCEYNQESDLPYVSIDDRSAAQEATEYLIANGRNKIAFINGPLSFKYARERRKGYISALQNAELTIPSNWLVQLPEVNYEMAFSAACQLLTAEIIPNAFFVSSDIFAAAVIRAAKRYHYNVPKDIVVVGFDNIDLSSMYSPSITTVSQPKFQEGFSACEMLLSAIANPNATPRSILLDTELVVRESSAMNSGI